MGHLGILSKTSELTTLLTVKHQVSITTQDIELGKPSNVAVLFHDLLLPLSPPLFLVLFSVVFSPNSGSGVHSCTGVENFLLPAV